MLGNGMTDILSLKKRNHMPKRIKSMKSGITRGRQQSIKIT